MSLKAKENKTKKVRLQRLNAESTDRPASRFSDAEHTIISRIQHDDSYVADAVRALYSMQTDQEQATRRTIKKNGVGLSASDALRFSKMAERINGHGELPAEDLAWCRRQLRGGIPYIAKYRRQLGHLLPPSESPTSAERTTRRAVSPAAMPAPERVGNAA